MGVYPLTGSSHLPLEGVVDYRGRPLSSRSTSGGWTSATFIIGVPPTFTRFNLVPRVSVLFAFSITCSLPRDLPYSRVTRWLCGGGRRCRWGCRGGDSGEVRLLRHRQQPHHLPDGAPRPVHRVRRGQRERMGRRGLYAPPHRRLPRRLLRRAVPDHRRRLPPLRPDVDGPGRSRWTFRSLASTTGLSSLAFVVSHVLRFRDGSVVRTVNPISLLLLFALWGSLDSCAALSFIVLYHFTVEISFFSETKRTNISTIL